ncbi:MAG: hypothetical protein DMF72_10360 [Acidobacteria bacterium]|nr:MAG: hypothetical protein DMF72_10360 [Acidobacteriota bacterium]
MERTTLSIKQIASAIGVGDRSHFIRDFGKEEGLSPRRYCLNFLTKNRRERRRLTHLDQPKSDERRTNK